MKILDLLGKANEFAFSIKCGVDGMEYISRLKLKRKYKKIDIREISHYYFWYGICMNTHMFTTIQIDL